MTALVLVIYYQNSIEIRLYSLIFPSNSLTFDKSYYNRNFNVENILKFERQINQLTWIVVRTADKNLKSSLEMII